MTGYRGDDDGWAAAPAATGSTEGEPGEGRSAAQVLADRVAAALIHHEPGWRLPRRSALARRYGVSPAEMEAAIEELSTAAPAAAPPPTARCTGPARPTT